MARRSKRTTTRGKRLSPQKPLFPDAPEAWVSVGKNRQPREARLRAFEALSRMRTQNLSLTQAARYAHTTSATVRQHVGSALRQTRSGRYAPTPSDRLTRSLRFLTPNGITEIRVRGSRAASRVGSYMNAVEQYLKTGSTDELNRFRGETIRAGKATHFFLTDQPTLKRLAHAGEVSFERLYAKAA